MDIFAPFAWLADRVSCDILALTAGSHLALSIEFFVYDVLKIFALLLIVTHLMGLVRYYLPVEKLRNFLTSHKLYGLDYFLATVFGALTPFCSCSSIPLFI